MIKGMDARGKAGATEKEIFLGKEPARY